MRIYILLILISGLFFNSFAQEEELKTYSEWYYKPSAGINIPVSTLFSGNTTDNLIGYDDNSMYWQFISANLFFSPNWGIEFTYQANSSSRFKDKDTQFASDLNSEYGSNQFTTVTSGPKYERFNIIGGNIERGLFGVIYRYEKPKIIVIPKLLLGITSFQTQNGIVYLKENGSNTIQKVTYDCAEHKQSHLTISPAITFGYRLSDRIIANIDVAYSTFSTNIEYTKTTEDLYTQIRTSKPESYKKNIGTLSIGAGIIFDLRKVYY